MCLFEAKLISTSLTNLNPTYSLPPKGNKYPQSSEAKLFRNVLSLNDVKMITALYYHIRLARIPLLMNFAGKIVLTSSVIYIKIFVCMYDFRIQLMTLSKMSTYTVTALEPYTPVIEDYAYVVYRWSRALHLFIRTR